MTHNSPDLRKIPRQCVGGDAHIAPLGTNGFALDFHKNGLYRRVDVGIDPYEPPGKFPKKNGRDCFF